MAEGYYAHPLLSLDSFLYRPVRACAFLASKRFRCDRLVSIRRFEQAPGAVVREVLPARKGWCHPARRCGQEDPVPPRPVDFLSVRVVTLADQVIEARSSYPFDLKRGCLYVDQEFGRLPPNGSATTGHLTAHGRRNALMAGTDKVVPTGDGVFLGGNGSSNYYHWLLEIVTKLHILPQVPDAAGLPLLVSRRVAELPSFAECLRLLAPDREWIYLDDGISYQIARAVIIEPLVAVPFHVRDCKLRAEYFATRPEAVHYLREAVLPALGTPDGATRPRRIFLTRGSRRTYNQDELVEVASRYGFVAVRMEEHSFLEQAALFANATAIIGPGGAAWANLVFANKECQARCWVPEVLNEFSAFSNIAGVIGLDFRHLTYPSGVCNPCEAYAHSYQIDLPPFEQMLAELGRP